MSTSRDERYYALAKPRRSPPTGDPQASVFFQTGQGGRTVLPPLSSAFPTSRFPVPAVYSNQYTQPRSSPGRYDYNNFNYNQCPPAAISTQATSSFPSYDNHDRYSVQPSYAAYPSRNTPPLSGNTPDSRKLPPLATSSNSGGERYPQSYQVPASSNYATTGGIRSPTASYPTAYAAYPSGQPSAYSYHMSSSLDPHSHHLSSNMGHQSHSSSYEVMDPSRSDPHRASPPYSRNSSHVSPPTYTPPPISPTTAEEPTIKKKRKRADAAQLKVLNETYNRTAFPSTEERLALAKALDMSARSVQIWFQNKRQSMRQTNRQSSTTSSSSHHSFSLSTQSDTLMDELSHNQAAVYANSMPMAEQSYMPRAQEPSRSHTSQTPTLQSRRIRPQEEVVDSHKWSRGY